MESLPAGLELESPRSKPRKKRTAPSESPMVYCNRATHCRNQRAVIKVMRGCPVLPSECSILVRTPSNPGESFFSPCGDPSASLKDEESGFCGLWDRIWCAMRRKWTVNGFWCFLNEEQSTECAELTIPTFSSLPAARIYHIAARRNAPRLRLKCAAWARRRAAGGSSAYSHQRVS